MGKLELGYPLGWRDSAVFDGHPASRDNATFSPVVANAYERIFGRSNVAASNGVQPGSIEADADGNVYFNVNATSWNDRFRHNLVLTRVDADGSLAWVRELQEDNDQEARDVGDNGEIGGGQDSLAVDANGDVYVTAQRSLETTAAFQALVMRVDGESGALDWAEGITNGSVESPSTAAQVLRGQSVDASLADRVLIAGQVADSSGAYLMALDKIDGALLWAKTFSISGVHRVAALQVDASGTAYLGGIAGNAPFVARIDGADGSAPELTWARNFAPSFANVHAMVLDGDGLLAAFDVRGAVTAFAGARIATADGSVVWAKQWDEQNSGDNDNAITVAMHDGMAVFGGRIALQPFDTQGGEGFLLGVEPDTGDYDFGAFYYGGKGAEEMATDYVTGLVSTANGLWVLHQQTPGSNNQHHFWGRWYQANDFTLSLPGGDGSDRLVTYAATAESPATATLTDLSAATLHPVADAADKWSDESATVDFLEPVQAESDGFQTGTHALLQRISTP